jgi:hypothetical protein
LVTAAVCAAVVLLGVFKGLFVAGGSDSYGYVSQAALWTRGQLVVHQPFARDMNWPNATATLVPLGYTLGPVASSSSADLVPVYSAGLPLVMAVFHLVAGPTAVFLVVPLLSALAVWATYSMGRRVAGHGVGAAAAVLLAASPPFLFETTSPTSDVPVTAWWASTLALLLVDGGGAACAAGLTGGLAVLTRPNLAPLATIPFAWLCARAVQDGGQRAIRRPLLFVAGLLPGCVAVAVINTHLYGSPLSSGYGPLSALYSWGNFTPNVIHYTRWMLATQTPMIVLGFIAPVASYFMRSDEMPARSWTTLAMWWCFAVAVLASYLFYEVVRDWSYVRFLLPAYPPLLVMTMATAARMLGPVRRRAGWPAAGVVAVLVVAAVARHGINFAVERNLLDSWKSEQRYRTAGRYVAARLPERAALLSSQHSGSARFYSGRLTVRYDLIPPSALDRVITDLRTLGYTPYAVLDAGEEADFQRRFAGQSARAALDWWPVAVLHGNLVRIYDLTDREAGQPDRARTPDIVP